MSSLHEIWRRLSGFLVHLDARRWRAIAATLLMLGIVVATIAIGRSPWGQHMTTVLEDWMGEYRASPWAIVIVIVVFCVSALFAAPQFVLIAACVVAFGPWAGFVYSWLATIVSAAMTYGLGRVAGQGVLHKLAGNHVGKFEHYIGKNTFSASFIIRNLPSAPFIVVNMAFGAARAPFGSFILGCTLGVLPKTALVALFGTSYRSLGGGNWKMALAMAALAIGWLVIMLVARRIYENGKAKG